MNGKLVLGIIVAAVVLLIGLTVTCVNVSGEPDKVVAEGVYKGVEYVADSYTTVLHFDDGRTFVMKHGYYSVNVPTGTSVQVVYIPPSWGTAGHHEVRKKD